MAQVINSNILSLTAQRNLDKSQGALATSLERLSSGLRINSAKDDAAGLAISERFSTQIRGLNQAIRNANDGISLSQTAEGALGEVSSNLQRIRELAVQSVNATNSDTDRATLDQEVQQRLQEIDRIGSQTSFNGRNVLDGSFGSALFQVGANVGETIGLDLNTSVRTGAVGAVATATSVDLSTIIAPGVDAVTGSAATSTFDVADIQADYQSVAATAAVTTGGVDLTSLTTTTGGDFKFDVSNASFDVTFGSTTASVLLDAEYGNADPTTAIDAVVAAIQTDIDATFDGVAEGGATFTVGTDASNQITITADAAGAGTITVDNLDVGGEAASILGTVVPVAGEAEDTSANGSLVITDTDGTDITIALTTDLSADDGSGLKSIIDAALGGEFTTTADTTAGTVTLTDDVSLTGSFSATLGGSALTPTASAAGVTAVTGSTALELTLGTDALTFQIGDGTAVSVAADTYSTQASFLSAVNTALGSNATASLDADTNVLSITSGETITIGGADAATFSATSFAAAGSLDDANVLTVAGANEAIQRIDAALTSTSDLRSTFGAIQNRFESTIANLSGTSENLSASRSRILDADFAAETAALTRAQILQQAGISVLSQANTQPQNVLALLN